MPDTPKCPKCGAHMLPSFSLRTFWCDDCGHVNDPEQTREAVERRAAAEEQTPLARTLEAAFLEVRHSPRIPAWNYIARVAEEALSAALSPERTP